MRLIFPNNVSFTRGYYDRFLPYRMQIEFAKMTALKLIFLSDLADDLFSSLSNLHRLVHFINEEKSII